MFSKTASGPHVQKRLRTAALPSSPSGHISPLSLKIPIRPLLPIHSSPTSRRQRWIKLKPSYTASFLSLLTFLDQISSGRRQILTTFPKSQVNFTVAPWNRNFPWHKNDGGLWVLKCFPPLASISTRTEGASDGELRLVLELDTDKELLELENILYRPSYFSPLLKSFASKPDVDYIMEEADDKQGNDFIAHLESYFLFLVADARSTLRG